MLAVAKNKTFVLASMFAFFFFICIDSKIKEVKEAIAKKGYRFSNLDAIGETRTTSNIMRNYKKWTAAGSKKIDSKNVMNCTNPPIFKQSKNSTILKVIPPPELHLLLGGVNTIYDNLEKEFQRSL